MSDPSAPLANVFTFGVRDLAALRDFYQKLGWRLVVNNADFAAFELRGSVLALFQVEKLAADGRGQPESGRGGIRFTIGIMTDQREDVDALARAVAAAGGRVTKAPADAEFFEGRSTYFADPEGNYWEIAWAPPDNPIVAAARRAAAAAGQAEA
jgi:predicted lactoylglutathione lyase